jgi:chemotaxis protein CheY-P-specific phosphatase CheC
VAVAEKMVSYAEIVHEKGSLILEDAAKREECAFLKSAMKCVFDAYKSERTDQVLTDLITSSDASGSDLLAKLIMAQGIILLQDGLPPNEVRIRLLSMLGEDYVEKYASVQKGDSVHPDCVPEKPQADSKESCSTDKPSVMDLTFLGEVYNTVFKAAAGSLSETTGKAVNVEMADTEMVSIGNLAFNTKGPIWGAKLDLTAGLNGTIVLLLEQSNVPLIEKAIAGDPSEPEEARIRSQKRTLDLMMVKAETALMEFMAKDIDISEPCIISLKSISDLQMDGISAGDDVVEYSFRIVVEDASPISASVLSPIPLSVRMIRMAKEALGVPDL